MVLSKVMEGRHIKVFEICNRSESSYTMKGTERMPNPVHLNAPKFKKLSTTSKVSIGKGKGFIATQWVPGAPVVNVDDVYVDKDNQWHSISEKKEEDARKAGWVLQRGLKSLGYDLKAQHAKVVEKNVGFEFGVMNLDKYGDDPALLLFVQLHADNIKAPNSENKIPGKNNLFNFRPLEEEQKAQAQLTDLDMELEAKQIVAGLRTKKDNGKFAYTDENKQKVDAILQILEIRHGLFQEDDYNQKHLAIKKIADANPEEFVEQVNGAFDDYKVQIGIAIGFKILEVDGNKVFLITGETGGKKDKRELISASEKEFQDKLVLHFFTSEGRTNHRDMLLLTEAAKLDSVKIK